MNQGHIRNFCIIAHIDHGKSTLADRLLELTGTVEKRNMKDQILDSMELERERGITIKLQPARMQWELKSEMYELNLIDTPGHVDFTYEVSRSLAAVEGAILLVDASQGVQAQTLSHFHVARSLQLPLLPVINKIDLSYANVEGAKEELTTLGFKREDIHKVSARENIGVEELLEKVLHKIPPPKSTGEIPRALIFDSLYDEHGGVIAYVRIFDGAIKKGDKLFLLAAGKQCEAKEVGFFTPARKPAGILAAGEIGYVVTGLKSMDAVRIGDTITALPAASRYNVKPLGGYKEPKPVVWASFFPETAGVFVQLGDALKKLRLNDAALAFEECSTSFLGRGYQCGFLGALHLEIVAERLRREFGLSFIITAPSVSYRVYIKGQRKIIVSPHLFPPKGAADKVEEPIIRATIIIPERHVASVLKLNQRFEMHVGDMESFGAERLMVQATMPLRTFVKDFFDTLHSVTSGYASIHYEHASWQETELIRIDVAVAGDVVEALSRVVSPASAVREAKSVVTALKDILPKEQFEVKIQAAVGGKILAAERLSAMRKDVTAKLYGGDVTRKQKLLKKQKKGKKRLSMQGRGRVPIPSSAYLSILKQE